MPKAFKDILGNNFLAAIDMLVKAIDVCPESLWHGNRRFFYLAYHTTVFLDYYLTKPVRDFRPLLSYTIAGSEHLPEEAVDDVIPDRFYRRDEVLRYLARVREKCKKATILSPEEELQGKWIGEDEIAMHGLCPAAVSNYTVVEILFYNLRHVQHHTGQLNYMLRQHTGRAPGWISYET